MYCPSSQMRGVPGVALEDYRPADIAREYATKKACAPYCTINCVQRVAVIDNWRSPQTGTARLLPVRPVPRGPATPTASISAPPPGGA